MARVSIRQRARLEDDSSQMDSHKLHSVILDLEGEARDVLWATVLSALSHLAFGLILSFWTKDPLVETKPKKKISVNIIETITEEKRKPETKIEKKSPPKPKVIKKVTVKKKKKTVKKNIKPKPKPQVVTGLSKKSLDHTNSDKSFTAPIGNTLYQADDGTRVRKVEKLEDLSSDASLLFFPRPPYTEEALDQEVEGRFVLELFINENGEVEEVDLRRQVGFGMDERIEKAAYQARFSPRRNKLGDPIPGWHKITIRLEIP